MKEAPTTLVTIVMVINATMTMRKVVVTTMVLGYHNHEKNTNSNNDDTKQPRP
jgi:hypothetical protein